MDPEARAIANVREFCEKLGVPEPAIEFRDHVVTVPSGATVEIPVALVREEREGTTKRRLPTPELRISPKALVSMSPGELRYRIARALAGRRRRPRYTKVWFLAAVWTSVVAGAAFVTARALGLIVSGVLVVQLVLVLSLLFGAVVSWITLAISMRKDMSQTLEIVDMTGEYDAAIAVNRQEMEFCRRVLSSAPGTDVLPDLTATMSKLDREIEKRRRRRCS